MSTESGFTCVNGARFYYETAGSGEAVVFLHGFAIDCRMWDSQWDEFSERYRVIRYDLRGFGKSDMPDGSSYTHADDLKAILDHLDVTRASVIGLSMGGEAAVNFALAYPAATKALVLVDASLTGVEMDEATVADFVAAFTAANESGIEAAKELWLKLGVFDATMEKPAVAAHTRQMISDYSGWHWVNEDSQPEPDPPTLERLGKIEASTLVIVGDRDIQAFHAVADTLRDNIAGARRIELPDAGHQANMDAPVEFNEAVLQFLADVDTS